MSMGISEELVTIIEEGSQAPLVRATLAVPSPKEIAAQWLRLPILFPILERIGRSTKYKVVAWAPGRVKKARAQFGRVDLVVEPEGGEGEVRVSAERVRCV